MVRMEPWLWLGAGVFSGAVGLATLIVQMIRRSPRDTGLAASVWFAISALGLVVGLVRLRDHSTTFGEALKTGGVAAGAIVALYALLINHRRHMVERDRADFERLRESNERFARSIELLGNEASHVKIGAFYSLANQALAEVARTQTVIDILCEYLRKPFEYPEHERLKRERAAAMIEEFPDLFSDATASAAKLRTPTWTKDERVNANAERQVRLVVQQLIARLVRESSSPWPLKVDLWATQLEDFTLDGGRVEYLEFAQAEFFRYITIQNLKVDKYINLRECAAYSAGFTIRDTIADTIELDGGNIDNGFALLGLQVDNLHISTSCTQMNDVESVQVANLTDVSVASKFECSYLRDVNIRLRNCDLEGCEVIISDKLEKQYDDQGQLVGVWSKGK
jgi:hypothetical protein